MTKKISIGKVRALQQCSTPNGALSILALDHRGNLRQSLRPTDPDAVMDSELTAFKKEVVKILAPAATAVLLDPEYGAGQCVAAGVVPGRVGLLTAVEETGYTGDPISRQSRLLPNWGVEKAKRMGASGVKLLAYYHPDAATAPQIEALIHQVVEDCAQNDIPVFLEPISYSPDPARKKLAPEERRAVVIESARRLTALGVDILKAEFPLDITAETDEREWEAACAELSEASSAPWVLLSASVDFETFVRQVTAACRAGASGVAVGRAVWKEATELTGEQRTAFLRDVAYPRMSRMTALCDALARPWCEIYPAPELASAWFAEY
jgi:tagatose 1,6-diphosphate aldolase